MSEVATRLALSTSPWTLWLDGRELSTFSFLSSALPGLFLISRQVGLTLGLIEPLLGRRCVPLQCLHPAIGTGLLYLAQSH